MNLARIVLPVAALTTAGVILVPTQSEAFTVIGTSLTTAQRHFKIFDNFTDASANDNVTPDSSFPGYTGVEMAIWKGAVEWGSRLHGTGNGDPSQIGGLGSGGANFDFYFMGNATGVGVIGDNICSEITGSSGGTLAYTEYFLPPGFNGWRMRFYSGWAWADGPTTSIPINQIDIQGVATHELGHALGLDHTMISGATMEPAITGTGVSGRSIAADDISGVQSIYGVASATKPVISGIVTSLGSVTINGTNFGATNNQVWFTQSTAGALTSVVVSGVSSVGGTSITVTPPANSGPGDILVKTSGSGGASLSNAWPYAPGTAPVCPSPYNLCFPSANSADPIGAVLSWQGTQFVSSNNFTLIATGCPANAAGLFFFGPTETFVPFGNGFRCVGGSIRRLPIITTNAFGDAVYNLNVNAGVAAGVILGNTAWNFQFWFRDTAAGGANFNLSDGLHVDFCP